jgi:hypothetical protein
MMVSLRKLIIFGMSVATFTIILSSGNLAYSADCLPELTNAENRWNKMRDEKPMTLEFERGVTYQLTLAAELRHQGMNDKCMLETKKAMSEMDLAGPKH